MTFQLEDGEYDLHQMLAKTLYFGFLINIAGPVALVFVCYYFTNHYSMTNHVGDYANQLFYVVAGLCVLQAGFALWWRHKLFARPMIKRKETFERDIKDGFLGRSRPVFLVIAAISVYGGAYFFLTGRFQETVLFVFFSFVVFQVVRPRVGSLRKLITHQQVLVRGGRFLRD